MKRGAFIVIYGISASGKSTQLKLLSNWLTSEGYSVICTKEPSNGPVGKLLKEIVRGKIEVDRKSLLFLFNADRIDHTERVIKKGIREGKIVICERYYLDTLAYHLLEGYPLEYLEEVVFGSGVLFPDLSIFIDISPEEALRRLNSLNEERKIYENRETLSAVRRNFKYLIERYSKVDQILVVNGELPKEDVFSLIKEKIIKKKILPDI